MRTHTGVTITRKEETTARTKMRAERDGFKSCSRVTGSVGRAFSRAFRMMLVVSLFAGSTPAAPRVLADTASEWRSGAPVWWRTSPSVATLAGLFDGHGGPKPRTQETQPERDARVRRVTISPDNVTALAGETIRFAAVAYDEGGGTVGGVEFTWRAQDESRADAFTLPRGEFTPTVAGTFVVTVAAGGNTAHTTVSVQEAAPPRTPGATGGVRYISSRDLPPAQGPKPARGGRAHGVGKAAFVKTSFRAEPPAPAAVQSGGSDTYGWNTSNYMTADDPGSQVGDPPGAPADGGAGNGNFQIAAPVVALPGRGIDLSLALVYNSHLWHKAGAQITYDIDKGWPAPGWSLGFGKMDDIGDGGSIIIEPDGTRHGFNGTITAGGGVTFFDGHTSDGSFINYSCVRQSGVLNNGWASLPNGTQIVYGAAGGGSIYPTRITDVNGNYITVTYRNNSGPQIDTVTDTLGRIVTFQYDSNNLLTAVTAPGFNGGDPRTLVRLHYQQQSVGATFAGLTRLVRDPSPWLIDAIYYPATGNGYWFGDQGTSPSYLANYGTIAKVVEQRGMALSASGLNDMGTVTQGTMSVQAVYNWQTPASDAPSYTTLTESWDGMDAGAAVTTYDVHENSSPRTVTVTLPDGTVSKQYSYNAPGQYNDGLIFKDETYDTDGTTLLSRSEVTWEPGDYSSPRPSHATMTKVVGGGTELTTGTEFTYAPSPSFNQATVVRSFDYGYVFGSTSNTLLRKTVTQYENSSNYTNNHVFNLPKVVEVYAGDDVTRVSRTEYTYDGVALQNTPNVTQHSDRYNPYAPVHTVPGHFETHCSGCPPCTCQSVWIPDTTTTEYQQATDYRGNLTQVKSYADAGAPTPSNAVTETRSYDITGNLVTTSSSCCELTSFEYTSDTQFAYATSKNRGSSDQNSPLHVTTHAAYDFNTGLQISGTDADSLASQATYYTTTLRPKDVTMPTGGLTHYDYDDTQMTVTQTTSLSSGGAVAAKSVIYLNGAGKAKREEALAAPEGASWAESALDVVETKYDKFLRVWKQSRPYRNGSEQPQWTTSTYDSLGRISTVEATDHSLTQLFYDDRNSAHPRPDVASSAPGDTTLVVDVWGRERWGRTDAQGRLVEVVEPNPDGSGSVTAGGLVTTYGYDTLGNMTDVVQGAQHRRFAYDTLSRLVRQKLAETDAVFRDGDGLYVGPGDPSAVWSDLFAYDTRSNLVSHTNARNVKTAFSYKDSQNNDDPLNRLQTVTYTVQTGSIAAADTVAYAYDSAGDLERVISITTKDPSSGQANTTETYHYDVQKRPDQKTITLASRPGFSLVTNYSYDNLDRMTDVIYPAQWPSTTRKTLHHDYDVASRLSGLTVDGAAYASQIDYNASSQATTLKVGPAGANQVTEKYAYDAATGLLTAQKAYRGSDETKNRLLDLSYDYLKPGTTQGRTGQLTKLTDNLNPEKGRTFSYDALGRLKHVGGGDPSVAALWTQDYSYDRYGNRTHVTASGNTASLNTPAEPKAARPDVEIAANLLPKVPEFMREKAKQQSVTDAPTSPLLSGAAAKGVAAAFTPGAPTNVTVTSSSATQVSLSWTPPAGGADHYEVERGQSLTGQYTFVGTAAGSANTFADTTVSAGSAYLYRVRAADSLGSRSAPSNVALGAAFTFTDDPIVAGVTAVKAQHVTELRQAVNAVRAAAGLPAATWTDPNLSSPPPAYLIRAAHIQELRDRLNEALTALQIGTSPFTDPVLSTGSNGTRVKKVHVDELRQRASRGRSASAGGSGGSPVPADGLDGLTYDVATNRINTAGWQYDAAGNQTRVQIATNVWQRYEYDAAERLVTVKTDAGVVIASYTYCYSDARLIAEEGGWRTYYVWDGPGAIAEYTEATNSTQPQWSKNYIYMGGRLLATQQPVSGGERVEYHHPDRLGTRVVSNNLDATYYEQTSLPFGTALNAESTGATNRRFTSYDRSPNTGLDYALNRSYDSQQGRFTQVDPIGMGASTQASPQTMNLYSYCGNDPVNNTDPSGLFFGKLFHFIGKVFKWLMVAVAVALIIVATINIGNPMVGAALIAKMFFTAGALLGSALGPRWLKMAIGIAVAAMGILQMKPGIIWNFSSTAGGRGGGHMPTWLVQLGSIFSFFQGRRAKGPRDSSKVTVDVSIPPMVQVDCPPDGTLPVSASGSGLTVLMNYDDGTHEIRYGGSRAWRNNNPGNITPGTFQGQIGKAGGFGIYNSEAAGRAAIPDLLSRPAYQALTVGNAIAKWAPPNKNNTEAYKAAVQNMTGISADTLMNTLSQDQLQSVSDAIRNVEGWKEGTRTCWRQAAQ